MYREARRGVDVARLGADDSPEPEDLATRRRQRTLVGMCWPGQPGYSSRILAWPDTMMARMALAAAATKLTDDDANRRLLR